MAVTNAFAPMGTINLSSTSVLHPNACNPAMDLVVVFGPAAGARTGMDEATRTNKGKARAETLGNGCKISLWRMGGSKVWEVDCKGYIAGMAWSEDGLTLSIMVLADHLGPAEGVRARLDHLSVHDGKLIQTTHLRGALSGLTESMLAHIINGDRWWSLEWRTGETKWPGKRPGCGRMIIDLLPRVTPVETPKAVNPMMLMMNNSLSKKAATTPGRHPKLGTFPSLLPSVGPRTGTITSSIHLVPPLSGKETVLLSGTFDTTSWKDDPSGGVLVQAEIADRLVGFLDVVLRGIEAAEQGWKEGGKQTMIWREELETCGEQQGMSIKEVHADLFKLLMTGRSGPAVQEWLGNRLTGRVVTKWETTLATSYKSVSKVIIESIQPALERIMLLLDELYGMQEAGMHNGKKSYGNDFLINCRNMAKGLFVLTEEIRRQARHEAQAASEWFRWIRYETQRAASQDASQDTSNTINDLKLVWAFSKQGFVQSPFDVHFPNTFGSNRDEVLPESFLVALRGPAKEQDVDLDEIIQKVRKQLTHGELVPTPIVAQEASRQVDPSVDSSQDMSIAISDDMTTTRGFDDSVVHPGDVSGLGDDSIMSDDTVEKKRDEPGEPQRELTKEPFTWAVSLCKECEALITVRERRADAPPPSMDDDVLRLDPGGQTLYAQRSIDGDIWIAFVGEMRNILTVLRVSHGDASQGSYVNLEMTDHEMEHALISAVDFFDDDDLIISHEGAGGLELSMLGVGTLSGLLEPVLEEWTLTTLSATGVCKPAPEMKTRHLGVSSRSGLPPSLAMNGRAGRRACCVMTNQGQEIQVFDMDADEGEEDEEEEAEEAEDEAMNED